MLIFGIFYRLLPVFPDSRRAVQCWSVGVLECCGPRSMEHDQYQQPGSSCSWFSQLHTPAGSHSHSCRSWKKETYPGISSILFFLIILQWYGIWFFILMSKHRGMFQYSLWPLAHLHHIQLGAMNAPIKAAAWDSVTNGPAVQHRWWRPRAVVRIFILMNLDILYRFCVTTQH